ncbi:hypothetical protein MMC11_000990 [Xylographa trunciseda]|nr:hypothetical protein [Xylographa trunciseda]
MAPGLLRLSTELVQEVMKYLFGYMHTIHIQYGAEAEYTIGSIIAEDAEPKIERLHPSILRVCSELRASGIEVLYAHHCFEFRELATLQWFVRHSETSHIKHLRFLLDKDVPKIGAWIAFWRSNEFKAAFPSLQTVEVDTIYVVLSGEHKRWLDIRLNLACAMLEGGVPEGCKVVKKYSTT